MENKLSFTKRIKEEICNNINTISEERKRAILSAFVRNVGTFKIIDKSFIIILKTDSSKIAKYLYKLIHDLYNISPKFRYEMSKKFKERTFYVLKIDCKDVNVLKDLRINIFDENVDPYFFENEDRIYGYICGMFLSTGSCNDPSSSNYHLEMAFNEPVVAVAVQNLINNLELGFNMRLIKRRSKVVLYLKKSDLISNFLVLIGAVETCLEFENTRVERDFANIDNRLLNLDGANYQKTTANAQKQIAIINALLSVIDIETIDNEKLRALIEIRLENEEASFKELSTLMTEKLGYPVSKSNITHLFEKIKNLTIHYTGGLPDGY